MTGLNACSEIQEWLDDPDRKPSVQAFHKRKKELEETLEPIMLKLSEPRKWPFVVFQGYSATKHIQK